jgi:hypothetical protein
MKAPGLAQRLVADYVPIRKPAGRGDGQTACWRRKLPPASRGKSAQSIGVASGRWLTLRQAQALLRRAKRPRARAIPCEVAAPTDGRASGAFTLEATVAARHADTPELSM